MGSEVKRRRGFSRISSKHQVTLPAEAMARAGLRPGDRLRISATGPGALAIAREPDPIEEHAGALTGTYPEDYLDRLRDEWA